MELYDNPKILCETTSHNDFGITGESVFITITNFLNGLCRHQGSHCMASGVIVSDLFGSNGAPTSYRDKKYKSINCSPKCL